MRTASGAEGCGRWCRVRGELAQIYAWTGEKDLAIEQLNAALKVPNDLHYGEIRLHPVWDLLRGDSRFEKLMEDAKKPFGPKEKQ